MNNGIIRELIPILLSFTPTFYAIGMVWRELQKISNEQRMKYMQQQQQQYPIGAKCTVRSGKHKHQTGVIESMSYYLGESYISIKVDHALPAHPSVISVPRSYCDIEPETIYMYAEEV